MQFKKYFSSLLGSALAFSPISIACENVSAAQIEKTSTQKENSTSNSGKQLIKNGFCPTDNGQSDRTISLDILSNQNLNTALKTGLEFILDDKKTAFIDNKEDLNKCILENDLLCDYIKKTIALIDNKEISDSDKEFQTLKKLTNMKNFMKVDDSIPENNNFFKFISAMEHAYKTVMVRKIADEILTENRGKVEKTMGSQNASSDANVGASANADGVILGISAGLGTSESPTETSFYTIDTSANIGVSVGVGLQKYLSLTGDDKITFTHSLISYSLEQFLDSSLKDGKISSLELRESDIKKIAEARKQMQEAEKKLIPLMQTSIEWYLKAAGIIPQNVNIKWPEVTMTKAPDKKESVNCSVSANLAASCLASAGMTVSTGMEKSKIYTHNKYLELINKDCMPSVHGENAETISRFLKQDKIKKYIEIKNFANDYLAKHPNLSDEEKDKMVSILVSNITGDIKMYNSALGVLADKNASKEEKSRAKNIKKETEKNWLKSSKIARLGKGRLEILKTSVSLAAYLAEICPSEQNKPLFEKLYNEIEHLAKMQAFSNKKSKQNAEYSTPRTCYSTYVDGKLHVKVPIVGTSALSVGYNEEEGDASFDTNKNITVQTQLPMMGDKILGSHSIRENFKKIIKHMSEIKNNPFAPELTKAVSLLDSNYENVLKELGVNIPVGVPDYFSPSKYMLLNFYFTKIDKTGENYVPSPLPGSDTPIITEKDVWAMKLIKRIDTSAINVNLKASDIAALGLSTKIGKASSKIGNNTLTFLINRFNVANTGFADNHHTDDIKENVIWQGFKNAQSEELSKLFVNMSKNTNARYELQCMWNEIIKNIPTDSEDYKKAYTDFKDFLTACDNLEKENSKENFDSASALFDKVLKLNYDFNYIPELRRVHSISHK